MTLGPHFGMDKYMAVKIRSWAIHNLFGHPLMQIFMWLGFPQIGINIHDTTMPNGDNDVE